MGQREAVHLSSRSTHYFQHLQTDSRRELAKAEAKGPNGEESPTDGGRSNFAHVDEKHRLGEALRHAGEHFASRPNSVVGRHELQNVALRPA